MQSRIKLWGYLVAIAGLAALGCSDPAADKPKAEVGDAIEAPATSRAEPSAEASPAGDSKRFEIRPGKSKIGFVGSKVTGSHVGEFKAFRGEISLPAGAELEKGQVSVEIEMASVETDTDRLTSHLKSGDFFLVEQFPKAVFRSLALEPSSGSDTATHTVRGELTLRGVTKPVAFPATIRREGDAIIVKSEFALNRKEFGIVYAGKPDDLIRDEVVISLDLRASS